MSLGAVACSDLGPDVAGPPESGLVYVRVEDGAVDLARVRIRDAATLRVTRSADVDETWPYWSEVARRLVFQRTRMGADARSDLWTWHPDTGEAPVTETPRRDERWPVWSPVEPRLVYAFRGGSPASGLAWVKPGSGQPARVLARADDKAVFFRPRFAPNGGLVVAQRRGRDRKGSQLWLVAPGTEPRRLTGDADHLALKASFTRDGGRIVFTRRPTSGRSHDVVSVDLTGGDLRRHVATRADEHSSRPSPTRDELVLVSNAEGSFDVWLAPLAGEEARILANTPDVDEFAPRWSPDGERIAVTVVPRGATLRLDDRESLGLGRIRVLDRAGRVLLETPGVMPDWMPAW